MGLLDKPNEELNQTHDYYYSYIKELAKDRTFVGNSLTEQETPPQHTKMIGYKNTIHMYGTTNPNLPYTEEGVDVQNRTLDERAFNPSNYRWDKAMVMSRKIAENYDFAPSGAIQYDSGTTPPSLVLERMKQAYYAVQALYKNFYDSLVNFRPVGLYTRDNTKVPMIRYANELTQPIPLPLSNVNRKIIPQIDVNLRSVTSPTHIPGTSAYSQGIKAAGLTNLKSQVQNIKFRSASTQLENKLQGIHVLNKSPEFDAIIRNSLAIDMLLNEQQEMYNKSTKWITNGNQYHNAILDGNNDYINYMSSPSQGNIQWDDIKNYDKIIVEDNNAPPILNTGTLHNIAKQNSLNLQPMTDSIMNDSIISKTRSLPPHITHEYKFGDIYWEPTLPDSTQISNTTPHKRLEYFDNTNLIEYNDINSSNEITNINKSYANASPLSTAGIQQPSIGMNNNPKLMVNKGNMLPNNPPQYHNKFNYTMGQNNQLYRRTIT